MADKLEYINELERRFGSSPEIDELRRRYTPSPFIGMTDQEEISQTAKDVFRLSTEISAPLYLAGGMYPVLKETEQLNTFKSAVNEINKGVTFEGKRPEISPVNEATPPKPTLAVRTAKSFGRSFVNLLAKIRTRSNLSQALTELSVMGRRIDSAKKSGLIPQDGNIKDYLKLSDEEIGELHGGESFREQIDKERARLARTTVGWKATETPEAENIPEKAADIIGSVAGYVTKLAVAKKFVGSGSGQDIVAWETLNQAEGGIPGAGAAMYVALYGIDKIPIEGARGFFAKTGTQSALFAGTTAVAGGDAEEIAWSALLPWGLRAWNLAVKGTVKLKESQKMAKAVKEYRRISSEHGLDLTGVPDKTLKFLISHERQAHFWNKQFEKGKISKETHDMRLDQIRQDMIPTLQAIAQQQPMRPEPVQPKPIIVKPAVEPPLKPTITTKVPPQEPRLGAREAGATTIIPDVVTEASETSKRLGSTITAIGRGTKEIYGRNVKRYTSHLRTLGERGNQVANDLDEITQRAQKKINNSVLDTKEILKGVNKENREKIAKAINGRLKKPPKWIQERANELRKVLDQLMTEANKVGIQRTVGGKRVPVTGKGKAFPQVTNAEGEKILKLAAKRGIGHPSVLAVAKEAVELGMAESVESYVSQLQHWRDEQLRGLSGYLERTRVELPEQYLEWDPDRVLDQLFQRNWLLIEGVRRWGPDKAGLSFPKLAVQTEGIRTAYSPDEAKTLEQFVRAAFGKEVESSEAARKITGAVRGYQFMTKIALSPLTITRNMLDRFAKTASFAPLSVQLRTLAEYPPFINTWLKHSKQIEEEMIRRGAVFSNTAIGEGYQPGHLITKVAGKAFASSERGNQVYIALAKRNAIDYNLKLLRTNPEIAKVIDKRFGKFLSLLEMTGRSPTQAQKRLRALGDEELLAKLESSEDIPPDLLDAILHKTVKDHAYPVVLSTKRSWWDNKPFIRMLTQFKVWGTDQVGHVWNDVIKTNVKNRDPSQIIAWAVTMAVMGELYNLLRDFILGKDESLVATLTDKERRNLKDVSITILKDMLDGGAIGILFDVIYGLANLIGGPSYATVKNLGQATVKTIWNPAQAKDALQQLAAQETPALRQTQGVLDKIDARFNEKNITQQYYKVRRQGFDWFYNKKYPTAPEKAKRLAVQATLGWVKNVPQERTLSYELAIRQILVGDIDDASEHLLFLLKKAGDDSEEFMSIEKGITSALNNASPLGRVAEKDLGAFFKDMSSEQRREAVSLQTKWDRNSAEAYSLALRKWQKWRRTQ